jgi:photosystem II stability/assembly factor-like uncharacterized protein
MRSSLTRKLLLALILACSFLLCLPPADSYEAGVPPASFKHIGPFGGDVRSLLLDSKKPSIVYLGSSNGRIFKSLDAGASWTALYPGIGNFDYVIDTLIQHPADPNHIYAGAWDLHSEGGGLFESMNAGLTWNRVMLPQPFSAVRGLSICNRQPARMIVGTLSGAYVSADGGRTWKNVGGSDLQKAESVAIDPVDFHLLYVGTWRLGYRSSDFGQTWSLADRGMPLDSDVFSLSVSRQNPEIVYSSACSGVYRSSNHAQSWTRLRLLPERFTIRAQTVDIDPADPHTVYSGTTEGLFVSRNDGQTWTRLTSDDVTVNAVQVDPTNNKHILIGTEYQGILASENSGRSWTPSNDGFIHKKVSWILPDSAESGRFIAGVLSGSGGFYLYDDHSRTWAASQIEPGMRILSFLILPNNRGKLAGTEQGIYCQAGGKSPWTKLAGAISKRTIYNLTLDPSNPVIYAGTDQGIYRASVESLNFRIPPASRLSPRAWCLAASKTNSDFIYAGTSLGLLRSYDRGTTWSVISAYGLPDRAPIESLAISPSDNNYLLAGTPIGLFESRNGGIHWTRPEDGKIGGQVTSILFLDNSGSNILAADKSVGGLFYSMDGGQTWDKIYSSKFESPVYCMTKDPERSSRIFVGTESDGVYILDFH